MQGLDAVKNYVMEMHEATIAHNFKMAYEGEVNQKLTMAFSQMAMTNLEGNVKEVVKKRLFHVIVECLQNIGKHSYDRSNSGDEFSGGNGLFVVGESEQEYTVTTGNRVKNDKAKSIANIIDELNGMDKLAIKEYYKRKIKESRISDKGGAGLGLIDIVKKTGNQISYALEPLGNDTCFLIMMSKVNRE